MSPRSRFDFRPGDNPRGQRVDPGDTLHYTIAVQNTGTAAATAAFLVDAIPTNTSYVADTLTLNGQPVGQPDGGVSPLIAGLDVSSSDLPLPAPGAGTFNQGESTIVEFDVVVDGAANSGDIISNQATVTTAESRGSMFRETMLWRAVTTWAATNIGSTERWGMAA